MIGVHMAPRARGTRGAKKSGGATLLAGTCAMLLAGCYEYLPAYNASTLIGKRVELALTDSGAVVLANLLGPQIEVVDATLQSESPSTYVVSVTSTRMRSGTETPWRGETLAIPRPLVSALLERRFSPTRSALAGGIAAVGVAAVTAALRGAGQGGQGGPVAGTGTGK